MNTSATTPIKTAIIYAKENHIHSRYHTIPL